MRKPSLLVRISMPAIALALAACTARTPAPVIDRTTPVPTRTAPPPAKAPDKPVETASRTHIVKKGETLVGIALQYGLDYRDLASWNGIPNPNLLSVGQVLMLQAQAVSSPIPGSPVTTPLVGATSPVEVRPNANTDKLKVEPRGVKMPYSDKALAQLGGEPDPKPAAEPAPLAAPPSAAASDDKVDWVWPAKGKVIATFTDASKGIDIAGNKGEAVNAAAAGRVVYSGTGLRGYGKLVILKHNEQWLSAYAHNEKLLVNEGDVVRKGQKIAEMGASDTDAVKLHFEIRKSGSPVDPLKQLPPS
jgi:lipoprotein NlpD